MVFIAQWPLYQHQQQRQLQKDVPSVDPESLHLVSVDAPGSSLQVMKFVDQGLDLISLFTNAGGLIRFSMHVIVICNIYLVSRWARPCFCTTTFSLHATCLSSRKKDSSLSYKTFFLRRQRTSSFILYCLINTTSLLVSFFNVHHLQMVAIALPFPHMLWVTLP